MGVKEGLLGLLMEGRGELVSGEGAARALGVSRAAVWKAVEALRREGVPVEALRGSGYSLSPAWDPLSAPALEACLEKGTQLRVFDSCLSTNIEAKKWAVEGAPHGALVAAARQTQGRGRLGRSFSSPPGGLYMSVVLRPEAGQPPPMLITAATACVVCGVVSRLCGMELGVKWVNDLFWQGKKCCGILTEAGSGLEAGSIDYLVVGIGVNYAVSADHFEGELADIATSLFPGGGAPVSRAQLAAEIHRGLLDAFAGLDAAAFLPEYRARSIVLGKRVRVMAPEPYEALAVEIDEEARLVVLLADGSRRALAAGEISVRL